MARKQAFNIPFVTLIGAAACICGGCAQAPAPNRLVECQNETLKLRRENDNLTQALMQANQEIDSQKRQIATLQKMSPETLKQLTRIGAVQLGRLTSAYRAKGSAYPEGIAVYIETYDASGHTIKAAGTVRIRLFDLQAEPPQLVGELVQGPEEVAKAWVGRFWTDHYSFRVPFAKTPKHRHITVQAEFTELLTGKTFVAEKLVEVDLQPTTTPATTSAPKGR